MTRPAGEETEREVELSPDPAPQDLLEAISTHAIFRLDAEGRIDSWSDSANTLYGYEASAIGHAPFEVLFATEEGPNPDLEALLSAARTGAEEVEHWNKRADGSVFWATLTLAPLDDEFEGYVVISQDTTVKRQYKQMLERQNDRLKEFTDILAHDLRNPLNVIDGRLDLYRETGEPEHLDRLAETT